MMFGFKRKPKVTINRESRNFTWEMMVELDTRVTCNIIQDSEGSDVSIMNSMYAIFARYREACIKYGPACAKASIPYSQFLNGKIRPFTTKWHGATMSSGSKKLFRKHKEFRDDLRLLQTHCINYRNQLSDTMNA